MMKKIILLFAVLALASLASARPAYNPQLEAQWDSMHCYAQLGDGFGDIANGYYTDAGEVPPAYIQELQDDLFDEGDSALWDLYVCLQNNDPVCFAANIPRVMSLVVDLKETFRVVAKHAYYQGWEDTSDIANDYATEISMFSACLAGEVER